MVPVMFLRVPFVIAAANASVVLAKARTHYPEGF
jgi:hypothetical protein